jgi:hypothetical protein
VPYSKPPDKWFLETARQLMSGGGEKAEGRSYLLARPSQLFHSAFCLLTFPFKLTRSS